MTTYLGKTCSFGLPRVPFVNCRLFMYLIISLLGLRAGSGICMYQFLIIAYLFTFQSWKEHHRTNIQSQDSWREINQQNLYHVFIDFKKAFDRVWHEALWATMRK